MRQNRTRTGLEDSVINYKYDQTVAMSECEPGSYMSGALQRRYILLRSCTSTVSCLNSLAESAAI
jgi:hypothetical protein